MKSIHIVVIGILLGLSIHACKTLSLESKALAAEQDHASRHLFDYKLAVLHNDLASLLKVSATDNRYQYCMLLGRIAINADEISEIQRAVVSKPGLGKVFSSAGLEDLNAKIAAPVEFPLGSQPKWGKVRVLSSKGLAFFLASTSKSLSENICNSAQGSKTFADQSFFENRMTQLAEALGHPLFGMYIGKDRVNGGGIDSGDFERLQ